MSNDQEVIPGELVNCLNEIGYIVENENIGFFNGLEGELKQGQDNTDSLYILVQQSHKQLVAAEAVLSGAARSEEEKAKYLFINSTLTTLLKDTDTKEYLIALITLAEECLNLAFGCVEQRATTIQSPLHPNSYTQEAQKALLRISAAAAAYSSEDDRLKYINRISKLFFPSPEPIKGEYPDNTARFRYLKLYACKSTAPSN